MIRQVIKIDEEKCDGCGLCEMACHEGAISVVDGKARLLREDFCDGLGDCLPACPEDAISFEEREAPAYDKAAVEETLKKPAHQWPLQIKLVPVRNPSFDGANLLIAADCTAYACREFQDRFMRGRKTLIGCPKLDAADYSQKLSAVFSSNDICSVTVAKMSVPCCTGLENAARKAVIMSGKRIAVKTVTISADGQILKEE